MDRDKYLMAYYLAQIPLLLEEVKDVSLLAYIYQLLVLEGEL